MKISKPRMCFTTRHTADGEILIKVTDVQVITAYTESGDSDTSEKWENELSLHSVARKTCT